MIPALLIGRGGSTGLPGKNTMNILITSVKSYESSHNKKNITNYDQ